MLAEHRTKAILFLASGFALQGAGGLMVRGFGTLVLGMLVSLTGLALFVLGCNAYAVGKGRSPAWGWLGLMGCFGLLVLMTLPDEYDD